MKKFNNNNNNKKYGKCATVYEKQIVDAERNKSLCIYRLVVGGWLRFLFVGFNYCGAYCVLFCASTVCRD